MRAPALRPNTLRHNPLTTTATICSVASVWIGGKYESMSLFKMSGSMSKFKASISMFKNIFKKYINIYEKKYINIQNKYIDIQSKVP